MVFIVQLYILAQTLCTDRVRLSKTLFLSPSKDASGLMRRIFHCETPQREFNNFKVATACSLGPWAPGCHRNRTERCRKIPQCRNEINQLMWKTFQCVCSLSFPSVFGCSFHLYKQDPIQWRVWFYTDDPVFYSLWCLCMHHIFRHTQQYFPGVFFAFQDISGGSKCRRIPHAHAPSV